MSQQNRRDFLKKATVATAAAAAATTIGAPAVHARKTYTWKMVTTWPPHFPVLGEGADKLAEWVEKMSDGRLKIQVYGGGELVPPLQAFDAVSQGMVEMGHGASYYWAGKSPATQFFAAVPFGMNAQQMNAWLYSGGGQELWDEVYAPFNLKPMPAGNTGVQMGGWFNREINTIKDFKGLKMRIPGLGGKVLAKAGGTAVLSAGGEIYTNLERGVIDATEWVGPYHDYLMGFYKVAKYYYYPGWHEPGTVLETFVNKKAWESLPKDLQEIVTTAAARSNIWMLSEFEAKNNTYLQKLIKEHGVQLKQFPDDVVKTLRKYAAEVIEEIAGKDKQAKKVYESFRKFQDNVRAWAKISENAFAKITS
ncbi:secreted protein [Geothermobacter ehrlichii]|uniref:Secreted protein n=1 Tax=Geothermobacter ehrlichii TaxID=213224 RepID=A0A5D3WK65_9BACT|nr:TRAP transporter substrate-binding protein [Geothermobacter ehrlichii]TYO98544.1 secreted protein [Geothermobacter ehrlichii]